MNMHMILYIYNIHEEEEGVMKKDQERERKGIRKLWGTGRLIHISQVRRKIVASVGWDKTCREGESREKF